MSLDEREKKEVENEDDSGKETKKLTAGKRNIKITACPQRQEKKVLH